MQEEILNHTTKIQINFIVSELCDCINISKIEKNAGITFKNQFIVDKKNYDKKLMNDPKIFYELILKQWQKTKVTQK